jgi:SAM-dependent methyltransferase
MNAAAQPDAPTQARSATWPHIQSEVWEPEAEALLDQIGASSGGAYVDLGSGAAGVIGPLSRRAGRRGRVVGVEPRGEQAAAVRRYAASRRLANVRVLEGDPFATGLPRGAFDLVHARFLLAATRRDRDLLAEMSALARPGGVVAIQEPDAAAWRCYPPRPGWDRLTRAVTAAAALAGGDLTAGQRAYQLLRRAGLEGVRVRTAVVALHDAHPAMRLPIQVAEALRRPIVDGGLLDEDDLDAALRECEQGALDAETFATTFLVVQAWGRKVA